MSQPMSKLPLLCAISALGLLGACISFDRDPPKTTRYLLEASHPNPATPTRDAPRLEVRAFHSDSAFAGRKLMYRRAEREIEADFYHELLVPPATALTEATRRWLEDSGQFATVRAGGEIAPDWVLEGDLLTLCRDERGEQRQAVLELQVVLVDRAAGTILLRRRLGSVEPVGSGPDELVAGYERALARALGELEAAIAELRSAVSPPERR